MSLWPERRAGRSSLCRRALSFERAAFDGVVAWDGVRFGTREIPLLVLPTMRVFDAWSQLSQLRAPRR